MRLVFLLFAESAEATDRGTLNIVGCADTYLPRGFPAVLDELVAVAQVEGSTSDLGPHVLKLVIVDPDGQPVTPVFQVPFVLVRDARVPYRPVNFTYIVRFYNMVFPRPGDYAAHAFVDDNNLGSAILYVR